MIHWQEGYHWERKGTQRLRGQAVDERNGHGNAPCFPTRDPQRSLCLETISPALSHLSLSVLAGHQQKEEGGPRWQNNHAIDFKDIC